MKKWFASLLCALALFVPAANGADNIELNKLLQNNQTGLWKLSNEQFRKQLQVNKLLTQLPRTKN